MKGNKFCLAVIDTNVIISALLSSYSDSATSLVLNYLLEGKIRPLYNEEILSEYSEVLHRKKFGFSDELISTMLKVFTEKGLNVERVATDIDFVDQKDVVFFEVALSKEQTYLVTGNIKHFPKISFVVTPAEMIRIIEDLDEPF